MTENNARIKGLEDTVVSLKELANDLMQRDRQRVAWRNLVEEFIDDDDIFMEHKIDIENWRH